MNPRGTAGAPTKALAVVKALASVSTNPVALPAKEPGVPLAPPSVELNFEQVIAKNKTPVSYPKASDNEPPKTLIKNLILSSSQIEDSSELLVPQSVSHSQSTSKHHDSPLYDPYQFPEVQAKISNHSSTRRRDNVIKTVSELRDALAVNPSNITTPEKPSVVHEPSLPLLSSEVLSTPTPLPALFAGSADSNPKSKGTIQPVKPNRVARSKIITKQKAKEKQPLMTPLAYAQKLQQKLSAFSDKPKTRTGVYKYLEGKRIFYIGGDMQFAGDRTRGRMDFVGLFFYDAAHCLLEIHLPFVLTQIVKHGGTLLPTYDASLVTHIVTDAQRRPTLRALGLRSLDDIPNHVPTVTWGWVISGLGRIPARGKLANTGKGNDIEIEAEAEVNMDDVCMHAAFLERFDAGVDPGPSRASMKRTRNGKRREESGQDAVDMRKVSAEKNEDFSRISCVSI